MSNINSKLYFFKGKLEKKVSARRKHRHGRFFDRHKCCNGYRNLDDWCGVHTLMPNENHMWPFKFLFDTFWFGTFLFWYVLVHFWNGLHFLRFICYFQWNSLSVRLSKLFVVVPLLLVGVFFQKFFSKNTFGLKSLQPSLFQIFLGFAHFSHWLFLLWPFYWFTKKSSSKIVTRIWIEYLICSVKLPAIWVVPRILVIICTDLKMSLHLAFLNCILVRIIQSKF